MHNIWILYKDISISYNNISYNKTIKIMMLTETLQLNYDRVWNAVD